MRCLSSTKRATQCLNLGILQSMCLMHYKISKKVKGKFIQLLVDGVI